MRMIALTALVPFAASLALGASVTRHDLRVTLDPGARTLSGEADLTLAPGAGPRVELLLGPEYRLDSAARLDGAKVRDLELGPARDAARPGSTTAFKAWRVELGRRGDEGVRLRVRWSGQPPALPKEAKFSRDEVAGMPSGYLSPDGAFLSGDAGWYPTGEQLTSSFTLAATVPAAWRVVSEGGLVEAREPVGGSRTERYDGTHPLEGIDLVAAPWTVTERDHAGTRIAVYALPDTPPDLVRTYLDAVGGYLDRYSRQIGPHAWPQFVVVEHILPTGYGMPSFTLLGSQVMRLPFIVKTSLGHEVLHDWWGNGVYVDRSGGNWCEGLTTYMADHAFAGEAAPGGDVEYRRQILRDYADYVASGAERPVSAFRERETRADRALGYGKVAMIFHMLRRQLGDEKYDAGLRAFYREFLHRRAAWADVRAVWSRIAGEPLDAFFAQWVDRAGAPELRLAEEPVRGRRAGGETLLEVRLLAPGGWALRVPIVVDIRDGEGATQRLREVARPGEPATVRAKGLVSAGRVLLDPEADVFRRLEPREVPAALSRVLAGPPDLVVLGTARGKEIETAARAIAAVLGAGRPVRKDVEVADAELAAARRVFVLGRPAADSAAGRAIAARLPSGTVVEDGILRVSGKEASDPLAAAVIVLDHPAPGQGALALVDSLSPAGLASVGRRMTHYGKYSYLLFAEDRPLVREVAPPPFVLAAEFGEIR